MKINFLALSGAALLATISTGATAGSPLTFEHTVAPAVTSQSGREFSLWGMGVIPTNYYDSGPDQCGTGSNCGAALGFGGSAAVYAPLNQNLSLSADLLFEYHGETDPGQFDQPGIYNALGIHLTNESNAAMPWGGFAFYAGGKNNEDHDAAGPVAGLGAEAVIAGFAVQAGGMFYILPDNTNGDDTLRNMYFIGASREFVVGNGSLTAGAMFGAGDFDESATSIEPGRWVQVSLFYEAPLGSTGMNWFAGYQGDFVSVDSGSPSTEEALFNSLKLGINIPIGAGAGAGPFRTPNFRAPLVNAGQFN